jgi:predicted nucleic acid-binding protein
VIGGKVVDASALAALIRGRLSAIAWFATAEAAGIVLYLPTLALAEVRAVRPDAAVELAEALGHSMVVLGEMDAANARQVDQLLTDADVFDAMAGHVVHVARQRGWPALSADSGRLRHVDPAIEIDLI